MNRNSIKKVLTSWNDFNVKVIFEGIIVGAITGSLIVLYRILLEYALAFARKVYLLQHNNYWLIPLWTVVLIAGGYITGLIVKKEPMSAGSGIPQVKGILIRKLRMNWLKVLSSKFIGGLLSIGAGLSLGREGPSVQIGAAVGQGFSRIFKKVKIEEKLLITSGASAGLSAAFNAPLSGVIFALEEIHKNFSPTVLIYALSASITADFVSKEFFGLSPVFHFKNISPIPLNHYLYLVLLGIILGVLGLVFNKSLIAFQDLYKKVNIPVEYKPVIPFLLAGIIGYLLPQVLGGGHDLANSLITDNFSIYLLLIILVVKFLFTMISYGSSAPGGIFLPLLVIGALVGVIFFKVLYVFAGFSQAYMINFIILAMAGYFSAIVGAPITGIVLITEMTGSFSNLLSISLVCMTSYIVCKLLKSKPIYETLLDRIINKDENKMPADKNKTIVEIPVNLDSLLEGKRIKDIDWPRQCLVVGIRRGEKEIIPDGNVLLLTGDYLIILTNEDTIDDVRECLLNDD